jgi:ADP-ribosylglycohydrolase
LATERTKLSPEASEVFAGKLHQYDPNNMSNMGFVLRALDRALCGLLEATDFESELIKVVNEGGDADTNGAITGGLLGAKFGFEAIPKRWVDALVDRDEVEDAVEVLFKYRGL